MARSLSSTLLTAQTANSRVPYVHMIFTSKDGGTTVDLSHDSSALPNRILFIDHVEELYNDYAVILLRDQDKGIPNVLGYWTEIGYGDTTATGNEYPGDGVNGGSIATPRLWVKNQQPVTAGGKLYTILELEGMWTQLRETLVRLGSAPLHEKDFAATTAYDVLEVLIETEMSWTLDAIGTQSDSIIDVLALDFDANSQQFEFMAGIMYRLIRLTKTFLRPRSGLVFTVRFPQNSDSIDLTFNSDSTPQFYEYTDRRVVHVPNRQFVYAKAGTDGAWLNFVTGDEQDTPSINAYIEIPTIALAPDISTADNADLLAGALLTKIKAESVRGMGLVPHHGAVELLDQIRFIDNRVSQSIYGVEDGILRVGALKHTYRPGYYRLRITIGGQSVTGDVSRSAGARTIVFTDTEVAAITESEIKLAKTDSASVPRPIEISVPRPTDARPSGPLSATTEQRQRADLFKVQLPEVGRADRPMIIQRDEDSGVFMQADEITQQIFRDIEQSQMPPRPDTVTERPSRNSNVLTRFFRRLF